MSGENLGIYIHVPFCRSKCPYCDFYSSTDESHVEEYVHAVCRELENWGKQIDKTVDTIYFGGGTPSILSTENIIKILHAAKDNFKINFPEITIEINPADAELLDFLMLHSNGVNRVSLGAQSLSDKQLKILGRRHNAGDIKKSVNLLQSFGIDNISLDIILGVPEQRNEDIKDFVDFCVANEITHVSAYILKIEEGTPYYFNKSGLKFWNDDKLADFYDYVCELLNGQGYNHYEISNFSKRGFESRHNLKYWNLDDYLGIGPSAHSFLNGKRFYYPKDLKRFVYNAEIEYEEVDLQKEFVMLGLRTKCGITDDKCRKILGYNIPQRYYDRALRLEKYGLVKCSEEGIRINESGFLLSNSIIADIL